TFDGSFPLNAPPPCRAAPPYVSTMVLRPVSPVSVAGPPSTNEPDGLTSTWSCQPSFRYCAGSTEGINCSMTNSRIAGCATCGACCVETTILVICLGTPSTYSTETWLFASGRSQSTTP